MLDLLRRGVKTWVAKALFALLVGSFAIWGIGDVFNFGISTSVATVGDKKIGAERFAAALNRQTRQFSQQIGQPIDAQMARSLGLPQATLSQLVDEAALDSTVESLGVSASDEAVRRVVLDDPSFRNDKGEFDQARYRYLLAQNGFSVEGYEAMARDALARNQLVRALADGAQAPQSAVDAIYRWRTETRILTALVLDEAQAGAIAEPDEAALAAWHEAHPEDFTAPERRSAVFLDLDPEALAADWEPAEEDVAAAYEARRAEFDQPERRSLYQLVYDNREEAEAALARLAAGESDFDGLIAARGETRGDVALGAVAKKDVAAKIADAAFGLGETGVAGPVDTGFGFALIEVAAIEPAKTTSLDEARPMILSELRRQHGLDLAPEKAGEAEERRAGGATLEEIAKTLGLTLGRVEGLAADGTELGGAFAAGIAADPAFRQELFAAGEGEERDFAQTAEGAWFVLRVEAIQPSELRPLDEVRNEVAAAWRADAVQKALETKAEALVARIAEGATVDAVAAELGLEPISEGPKTRNDGWGAVPAALVERLFNEPVGGAGFEPAGQTVVIAAVASVAEGQLTAENIQLRDSLERQMNNLAAEDALALFAAAKRSELGVHVDQQTYEAMIGQAAGR